MVVPTVILQGDTGKPALVSDNDAMIHFNFRSDRAQQLARAFAEPNFNKFSKPPKQFKNLMVVTMTEYDRDLPVKTAFPPMEVVNGFAANLSQKKMCPHQILESQKNT